MIILSSVYLFSIKPDWTSLSLDSAISDSLLFRIIVNFAILSSIIGLQLEHIFRIGINIYCFGQVIYIEKKKQRAKNRALWDTIFYPFPFGNLLLSVTLPIVIF